MFPEEIDTSWNRVHPATKLCHMIDFVVMRKSQRKCCLDVQAMRGADCWTDHYMVRAKLRMTFFLPANVKKHPLPFAVHRLARLELHECYVQSLAEKLTDWSPASEDTAEECWNHLHSSITCSAEEIIGREVHSSPEWFEENVDVLEPLIQEKNHDICKLVRGLASTHSGSSNFWCKRLF